MEPSSRQRYRTRRQSVAVRHRNAILIGSVLALVLVGATVALRRPTAPSAATEVPTATQPTTVSHQAMAALPTAGASIAALPTEAPTEGEASTEAPPALAPFFDDRRFVYEPDFYVPQLQAYLDTLPSPLKQMTLGVGDGRYTFAEVLVGQTSYYSINPKVVLALLETQSHLLSSATPSGDQIALAMGFGGDNGNKRGLQAQIRWAVRQMFHARRTYPEFAPLTYADQSSVPVPAGMTMSEYAVASVLAPSTTPAQLPNALRRFQEMYTQLFGDPRQAQADLPAVAQPFLSRPFEHIARVTSFFDHSTPLLTRDPSGSVTTYWGRDETDLAFAYDGHDGWDYALAAPDLALAAADGTVVFVGNADDNCATRAVVLDHGNGYRTLYWHLSRVDAQIGQTVQRGQPLGVIGDSGCAQGPHLHFGTQYLGSSVDPYGWCGADRPDPWRQNPFGNLSVWLWQDRPTPCGALPAGAVVVDNGAPGFAASGPDWQVAPTGYDGNANYVPSVRGTGSGQPWDVRPLTEPSIAVYKPNLPSAGRYRVLAYVPYAVNGLDDVQEVRYRVQHSGGEAELVIDQEMYANDWIDLGTYDFAAGDRAIVSLSNLSEQGQLGVWADAVMWIPVP